MNNNQYLSTKGWGPWKYQWYSICSMHRIYRTNCKLCQSGTWVNCWINNVDHLVYNLFPKFWIWKANLKFFKNRSILHKLFSKVEKMIFKPSKCDIMLCPLHDSQAYLWPEIEKMLLSKTSSLSEEAQRFEKHNNAIWWLFAETFEICKSTHFHLKLSGMIEGFLYSKNNQI